MTAYSGLIGLRYQDGWQNSLTGLGLADGATRTRYSAPCWRSAGELTDMYRYNWLARKLVESMPFRALARGVDESTPLPERFDELNYAKWDEGALMRVISLGRLYGGAHLFIGYEGGGPDLLQPPSGGRAAFLDVFTRHELTPATLTVGGRAAGEARDTDPLSPTVGEVTHWRVTGDHPRKDMVYHRSRAIAFGGNSLPPAALAQTSSRTRGDQPAMANERDWSDSVLLKCWEDIQRYGTFWQSIGHLLNVKSIGWLKLHDLVQMLAQESQALIKARIDVLNQSMSITRNVLLSEGEEFGRTDASMADIPALLDQLMQATSGAFDMPATELFGRAPQGMNATGESDAAMWEARVTEWRNRVLRPRMNALCSAIAGNAVKIEYPEVRITTDEQRADLRLKELQGDDKLWSIGSVSPDEIRKARHDGKRPEEIATGPAPEPPPPPAPPPGFEDPKGGAPDGGPPFQTKMAQALDRMRQGLEGASIT